jgi:nucleotide-binding universal stress UspA family protein
MNRILVCYDESPGADQAVALAAAMPWDSETVIHLVTAVDGVHELRAAWGPLASADPATLESEARAHAIEALESVRSRMSPIGLTVDCAVVTGRAPQALAEEARRLPATLMIVGSRGLGTILATLLGSVSAELVDIAPCPILVARSASVRGIVFATDGSPSAEAAEEVLANLPIARRVPVRVLSSAEVLRVWTAGIAPTMYHQALAAQADYEAEMRQRHDALAAASCARLAAHGIDARADVRPGDPAAEVLAAAAAAGADLIVLGSRGQTGLRRLILGSVARRVLHHAPASVLVVRAGTAVAQPRQTAVVSAATAGGAAVPASGPAVAHVIRPAI